MPLHAVPAGQRNGHRRYLVDAGTSRFLVLTEPELDADGAVTGYRVTIGRDRWYPNEHLTITAALTAVGCIEPGTF